MAAHDVDERREAQEQDAVEDADDFDGADQESPGVEQAMERSDNPVDRLVELVEYLAGNVVEDPSAVQIIPQQHGANVHIKLLVPEEEMGRVIGRQGRIARSMRTLLTIAASRKGLRASLDIDS